MDIRNVQGQVGMVKRNVAVLESKVKASETKVAANHRLISRLQQQLDTMAEKMKKLEDETNIKLVRVLQKVG